MSEDVVVLSGRPLGLGSSWRAPGLTCWFPAVVSRRVRPLLDVSRPVDGLILGCRQAFRCRPTSSATVQREVWFGLTRRSMRATVSPANRTCGGRSALVPSPSPRPQLAPGRRCQGWSAPAGHRVSDAEGALDDGGPVLNDQGARRERYMGWRRWMPSRERHRTSVRHSLYSALHVVSSTRSGHIMLNHISVT